MKAPFALRATFGFLIATTMGCENTAPSANVEATGADETAQNSGALALETAGEAEPSALQNKHGKRLFEQAPHESNGRSCATCHVLNQHTALSPANVADRLAKNPRDPLFNRIDADDPNAAQLTYKHLKKGLVRVNLTLPNNMDVIDVAGHVVTPANRSIFVWRGVPTVENTAITGPYQLDGRVSNLPDQAQAAITAHAEGPLLPRQQLEQIAAFERSQFSSPRAALVALLLQLGVPENYIPNPERSMQLTATERRGRDVFEQACAPCHGGATTTKISNRTVHDALFFALKPDGNVIFDIGPDGAPVARLAPRPNNEFLNIGFGLLSSYGQLRQLPMFNSDVELPRYRFRFYTDGTRTQHVTDLPPIPVTASGDPLDLTPKLDERGAPIVGPSLGVQWFSSDPGRAAITGDPADFEAFDVPQLRGIAQTAPYFHDNSSGSLNEAIDNYSRFVLSFIPLNLPATNPPEQPGLPPESLSKQQKQELLAFLQKL